MAQNHDSRTQINTTQAEYNINFKTRPHGFVYNLLRPLDKFYQISLFYTEIVRKEKKRRKCTAFRIFNG